MYDQDDGEGIVTRSQVRDFLIDTYSLLSSIIGTLPRRGDTIVEIDGDYTFIFEVMALVAIRLGATAIHPSETSNPHQTNRIPSVMTTVLQVADSVTPAQCR